MRKLYKYKNKYYMRCIYDTVNEFEATYDISNEFHLPKFCIFSSTGDEYIVYKDNRETYREIVYKGKAYKPKYKLYATGHYNEFVYADVDKITKFLEKKYAKCITLPQLAKFLVNYSEIIQIIYLVKRKARPFKSQ